MRRNAWDTSTDRHIPGIAVSQAMYGPCSSVTVDPAPAAAQTPAKPRTGSTFPIPMDLGTPDKYGLSDTQEHVAQTYHNVEELAGQVTGLHGKVTALDGKVTALDGKVTAIDDKVTALADQMKLVLEQLEAAE